MALIVSNFSSSAQSVSWATHAGSADTSGAERALATACDAAGNSYIAGTLTGAAAFGELGAQSHGGADAFLAKMNARGEFVWVRWGGGRGDDYINSIAVTTAGRIIVLGVFSDTASFDTIRLATFQRSYFLAAYDSAGSIEWIHDIGMEGESAHTGLVASPSGALYAAYATHITKFDSGGASLWDRRPGVIAFEQSIALGTNGSLYVTGQFGNSVTFGSTTLSAPGLFDFDLFVAKLDTLGNAVWARQAGSRTPLNNADAGIDIAVDGAGYPVVTGTYFGKAGFGTDTLTATDTTHSFIVKYSPQGNVFWLKDIPLDAPVTAVGVVVEDDGHVDVAGNSGAGRWFIYRLDQDAIEQSMDPWGNSSPSFTVSDIAILPSGICLVAGSISAETVFGTHRLTCSGTDDIAAAALSLVTSVSIFRSHPSEFTLLPAYPNPFNPATTFTLNIAAVRFPLSVSWAFYDVTGRRVGEISSQTVTEAGRVLLPFNASDLSSGVYYCRAMAGRLILTASAVLIR